MSLALNDPFTTTSHPESWSSVEFKDVTALKVHMDEARREGTSWSTIPLEGTGGKG